MKLECDVVRDLLPLYAENMVSERTRALTEAHLAECSACSAVLAGMTAQEPDVRFRTDSAQQFVKYEKKKKRRFGWKIALITAAAVSAAFLLRILTMGGLMAFLALGSLTAKVEEDSDPAHYAQYMGKTAEEQYRNKWGMDESVFPAQLTDDMDVPDIYPAVPSYRLMALAHKYAPQAVYGIVRSHDGFYVDGNAETEAFWSGKGIVADDMESGILMVIGRQRGMETLSILNNVVLYQGDLADGVNSLVGGDELMAKGEEASLRLALDILSDPEGDEK